MFRAALLAILAATAVYGQQPRFEVASIRPGGDEFSTKPQRSPGRFAWTSQLAYMIGYAYGVDFSRVSGKGLGEVYTIAAVTGPEVTEGELRLMLQSLLAERFNLRLHRSVQEVDGYTLSIARNGSKLKEAGEDQAGPRAACGSDSSAPMKESYLSATMPFAGVTAITGHAVSLAQVTEVLARNLRMPVWDQTGLERKYDFAFCFAQDLPADSKLDFPSVFTALGDLGLTLKKERGPLESLVVDRLDPPTEN